MIKNLDKKKFGCFIGFAILIAIIVMIVIFLKDRVGLNTQDLKANWYSSAVLSADGKEVAYFKRYLEYTHSSPRVSLLIGEETNINVLKRDQLFLCINDITGKAERVIKEVAFTLPQPDQYTIPDIYTAITWESNNSILYGAGKRDVFATGIHRLTVNDGQDKLVEDGFEAVGKLGQQRVRIIKGLEIYSDSIGSYGNFGDQTIYIFNHNLRTVSIYLNDPLSKKTPNLPSYSVTGK